MRNTLDAQVGEPMREVSPEVEIGQLRMGRPHVVLLGAGASRAAFPDGDANGCQLPLMMDFADIVPVGPTLESAGVDYISRNFEEVYFELSADERFAPVRAELETVIHDYFAALELPATPTIYDYLVLSLQPKDVIATFNWDPFLLQAVRRNLHVIKKPPSILFLHGNVLAGYCSGDHVHGVLGYSCRECGAPFQPVPLLYPVGDKDYGKHPAIADSWNYLEKAFADAFMVTVFGYGAPKSDAAAVTLLSEAWGGWQERNMEEFEFIDVRDEDDLLDSWSEFVHTHHYEVHASIHESWLLNHPRRTGEAYINQFLDAMFISKNPVPRSSGFEDLWRWFQPLLARERAGV